MLGLGAVGVAGEDEASRCRGRGTRRAWRGPGRGRRRSRRRSRCGRGRCRSRGAPPRTRRRRRRRAARPADATPTDAWSSERARIVGADVVVEPAHETRRGGARLGLGLADDHVHAVAEAQPPSVARGPRPQVVEDRGDRRQRVGPQQVHVGGRGRDLACGLGEAAEVERRAAPRDGAGGRRARRRRRRTRRGAPPPRRRGASAGSASPRGCAGTAAPTQGSRRGGRSR